MSAPAAGTGPVSLPLAEALIAWSDPALIEAIRTEEAKVPTKTLEAFDRYTLTSILSERRAPNQGRILSLSRTGVEALDRAWDRLFAAFRFRIESGDFGLEGTCTLPGKEGGRKLLVPDLAATFKFDPAGGAVFVGFSTYLRVVASRPPLTQAKASDGDEVMITTRATDTPTTPDVTRGGGEEPDNEFDVERPVRRGREPYKPLIREAVVECWERINRDGKPAASWAAMAGWIRKHMVGKYADLRQHKKLPEIGTIRIHLPPIYQEILRDELLDK